MGTYKRLRRRFTRWWLRNDDERPLQLKDDYDLSVPIEDWPSSWHIKRSIELFKRAQEEAESMEKLMDYYGADWNHEQVEVLRTKKRDLQEEALFHLQLGQGMKEGWYPT